MSYSIEPDGSGGSSGGGLTLAEAGLDFRRMSVLTKFLQQTADVDDAVDLWIADAAANDYSLYAPAGTYILNRFHTIANRYGPVFMGEGRGRTIFTQGQTWADKTYHAAGTAGCTITQGSAVIQIPAEFAPVIDDVLARTVGADPPVIFVYGAGSSLNDRFVTTIVSRNGLNVTLGAALPDDNGSGAGTIRIVPPAMFEFRGVEQAQVSGFTIGGYGSEVGNAKLWAGIRCGSSANDDPDLITYAQRTRFFDLHIGGVCTAMEMYGRRDGNNDMSNIDNVYFANVTRYGVDLMDSQQFDWGMSNATIYGDADWYAPKVCSVAAAGTTLTCPIGPFRPFHIGALIEVDGAAVGGAVLVARILYYVSTTQVVLDTPAVVAVVNAAALHIGAQAGIHMGGFNGGGNITARGRMFIGTFLRASVVDESFNGSNFTLSDGRDEGSRALYEQPMNSGIYRPTLIEGYTFAQGSMISERATLTICAGPTTIKGCQLGSPSAGAKDIHVNISPTTPAQFVCSMENTRINTELPRDLVFSRFDPANGRVRTARPSLQTNVIISTNAGTILESIDAEVWDRETVGAASQPLVDAHKRLSWGQNESPDLSSIYPGSRIYLDAGWLEKAPLQKIVGFGGAASDRVIIPSRDGNAGAYRDFTPGDVNFKAPVLQAFGKNGRRGWRFDFGRALFIPPSVLTGLTQGELLFVGQILTQGGGMYALGNGAHANFPQAYDGNIYYEDFLMTYRENTAVLPTNLKDDVMIVRVRSNNTGAAGSFRLDINGISRMNTGATNVFLVPTNPGVFGAGGNNAAGNNPATYGTFVASTLLVSPTIIADVDFAKALVALREYYGGGTV